MIAIIGGGISGLSLGYYLKKSGNTDFKIFEKEDKIGGKIYTQNFDNYFLEHGPNTLLSSPLLNKLIQELNLESELIHPDSKVTSNRYVLINGKVSLLPASPISLIFNSLLSLKAKFSILKDLRFKPKEVPEYQTVSEFFTTHFCKEIDEKFVKSFCRGIYASDSKDLLIKTCFPSLAEYQEKYGSIIKGMKANSSLEKRKVYSFKEGLFTLCKKLEKEIATHIELNTSIESVTKNEKQFYITYNGKQELFDKIIFCNEASSLSNLLVDVLPETSESLSKVNYAQLKVCHSVYNTPKDKFPYAGFGVLNPPTESKLLFGHIWNSQIFSDFNKEQTIITTMAALEDEKTIENSIDEYFKQHFNISKTNLESRNFVTWKEGIPRYDSQHLDFVKKFSQENKLKLYICSNLLHGVSIPDRILESKKLAEQLKNEE